MPNRKIKVRGKGKGVGARITERLQRREILTAASSFFRNKCISLKRQIPLNWMKNRQNIPHKD